MTDIRQPGPFTEIGVPGGPPAPLYLIPFDKEGRCIGPKTLEHLLSAASTDRFTDLHIYSHGWNNVFREAVDLYTEFFTEYFALRQQANLEPGDYRPLLVGVIWPSTALVSDADEAPKFAATVPAAERAKALETELIAMEQLASELRPEDISRFFELTDRERIGHDEAIELANMLLPIIERENQDREGMPQAVTAEKLVRAWEEAAGGSAPGDGGAGALPDEDEETAAAPARPAGIFDLLNPKNIVRTATVYQMKDRAGRVGAGGVGPMLHSLLANTDKRVHLAGHSYGAKVMLSALALNDLPRKVHSVLLLQPAVNAFCFAASIAEHNGQPGAYRLALTRSTQSILTTFSSHDSPLTTFFHIALRRDGDLGEVRPAAGPPSRFAALGGFGPGGLNAGESITVAILKRPDKCDFGNSAVRLIALDGSNNKGGSRAGPFGTHMPAVRPAVMRRRSSMGCLVPAPLSIRFSKASAKSAHACHRSRVRCWDRNARSVHSWVTSSRHSTGRCSRRSPSSSSQSRWRRPCTRISSSRFRSASRWRASMGRSEASTRSGIASRAV